MLSVCIGAWKRRNSVKVSMKHGDDDTLLRDEYESVDVNFDMLKLCCGVFAYLYILDFWWMNDIYRS